MYFGFSFNRNACKEEKIRSCIFCKYLCSVVYVFQSGMKEEVFKKQQQQILESFCISATKAVMSEERRCDWRLGWW